MEAGGSLASVVTGSQAGVARFPRRLFCSIMMTNLLGNRPDRGRPVERSRHPAAISSLSPEPPCGHRSKR
jgi:hypothetical protein